MICHLNLSIFRKPQYNLSSPLPLNLFSCEFEDVKWILDQESFSKVISSLQSHWTTSAVKYVIPNFFIYHLVTRKSRKCIKKHVRNNWPQKKDLNPCECHIRTDKYEYSLIKCKGVKIVYEMFLHFMRIRCTLEYLIYNLTKFSGAVC